MKTYLKAIVRSLTHVDTKRIYLYSLVIGAVTGLGAIVFYWALSAAVHVTYEMIVRMPVTPTGEGDFDFTPLFGVTSGDPRRWVFLIMPALGGLLAGWIVYRFAPEAAGTGTEGFIDAFHNRGGVVRRRVALVKSVATICTLASGGSAGKEGPVSQIGASIGSTCGSLIRMGPRARRTLLLAGAAGGLGAIFRAPLGGTFTAIEALYKEDFETDALIPCLISSVMAYTVFCSVMGFGHIFSVDLQPFDNPLQLILYIALGFLCSAMGYLYIKFFHTARLRFFDRIPVPRWLLPAIGGLLVGLIGFFQPEVTGAGFGLIQSAINGDFGGDWQFGARFFLLLAVLKIIATTFTVQSGGSGGVFGPSLVIGAMLGGFVGTVSHHFFPELVPDPAPFVIVGMASFFAGVARAPIASIIMVSEMTGGYQLLPALMAVATISLIFSRGPSIYRNQVLNKFASQAHLWNMNPNVLARTRLADAFRGTYESAAIVRASDAYPEVERRAAMLHETDFIVADPEGRMAGTLSLRKTHFMEEIADAKQLLLVDDVLRRDAPCVQPEDSLFRAMEIILEGDFDKVAVVRDPEGERMLLGYVAQKDILNAYRRTYVKAAGPKVEGA